ncbi:MAG TPA: stage V sporulation protein D [Verrucomicrobiae bacterium]|nr:stage V sporulation protein D [Verrucomicrobiae bacterium]
MSTRIVMRKRVALIFLVIAVCFSVIIGRLVYVQVANGATLRKIADDYHYRGVPVSPKRGDIEDRVGNKLAVSISTETVYAIPAEVRASGRQEEISNKLAPVLGMDAKDLLNKLTKRSALVYLKKRVDTQVGSQVRMLDLPGVWTTEESQRYYPKGVLAAHIIGFAGIDNQGLEGIELTRDEDMRGTPGSILTEYTAGGIRIPGGRHSYIPPKQGNTVRLTIDANIQAFAERELDKLMSGQGQNLNGQIPKNASVLVMSPKTGELLALASRPTFDPNNYKAVDMSTRRNIAVQNGYEPGSTFKIVTLAAALQEKKIKPTEGFFDPGSYTVLGKAIRCWKAGGHGSQTFLQVAENSCNPGFIEMGQRLGMDNFYKYLQGFGFGQKTGIEMSGEAKGILAPKKRATALDLATMSIGQTNNVTPIQLITAVSAVANGGTLLKPQLVKDIVSPSGEVVKPFEPQVVRRVIDEDTAKQAREFLESVVTNGTGRRAFLPGYRVAGKTGTAQKVANGRYMEGEYVASFIGFAPANDPQLVVLAVIDGVRDYGGMVASPVVQGVLLDSLKYLGIKPQEGAPLTPKPLYGLEVPPVKKAVTVPAVLGMNPADAEKTLRQAGFAVTLEGSGPVVVQTIPYGESTVEEGTNVLVVLGNEGDRPALAWLQEEEDEDIAFIKQLDRKAPEVLGRLKE